MTETLAYELIQAKAPTSDPIVLLGSLGSDRTMWTPQIAALPSVADVVAVDLRGHGESPAPDGPYSVQDLAEDVVALIDSLSFSRVHLVGLSLGGAVSQWIAIHRPDVVSTLTLICTAAKFGESSAWHERAAAVRRDGTGAMASSIVDRWFTPALAERDPALVVRSRAMVDATSDEGYAACCEALAAWDSRADLGRIVAPTLVIAGAQDPATPPSSLQVLADGIVDSTLHVLDPGAHLASVEQAGAVTSLIAAHVEGDRYAAGRAAAHTVGTAVRREVLGDAHVDRSIARITDFTAPFQDFITRTAWGDVWKRPGLDQHTRRLLTLAILTAAGNDHELDMHIRAALSAGVDPNELGEVFLHTAVYAGVPNSNNAFALADAAIADAARTNTTRADATQVEREAT